MEYFKGLNIIENFRENACENAKLFDKLVDCDKHYRTSAFPYIPTDTSTLRKLLECIKDNNKKESANFVDAGCGFGDLLFCVKNFFPEFNVSGFEVSEEVVRHVGRKEIICGDICNQDYSNFDIIYSFLPMRDRSTVNDFTNKVFNEAKKGSIIVLSHFGFSLDKYEKFEIKNSEKYQPLKVYVK